MHKPVILQRYGNSRTIWVAEPLIQGAGENYLCKVRSQYKASVPAADCDKAFLPATGKSWRWGSKGGVFYYDYDTIPNNAPKHYRETLPSEDMLLDMGSGADLPPQTQDALIIDKLRYRVDAKPVNEYVNAVMSCDKFMVNGSGNYVKALDIARKRAWLEVIHEVVARAEYISLGIPKQKEFWRIAHKALEIEGWKLSGAESLRIRYYDFRERANEAEKTRFFLGKYGNGNRRIVGKTESPDTATGEALPYDVHEAAMYALMSNYGEANKEFKKQLHREYRALLLQSGMQPAGYRTFCRYTDALWAKIHITFERDGYAHLNNNYLPYIAAAPVRHANSLWAADGSGSKLGYLCPQTNKIKSVYVLWVFDVASKKVMGYCLGKKELPEMVLKAFAKAFKTSGDVMPMEIVSDNGSAFSGQRKYLSKLSRIYRNIAVGNSQANPAEGLVKMMINSCRGFHNWMYGSFHAKSITSEANPDDVKANRKNLPSFQEVELQIIQHIKVWNDTKARDGLSPNERYEMMGIHPECKRLNERDRRYVFGDKTEVDVSYMRGKVVLHKGDNTLLYDIPDYINTIKKIGKMTGFKGDAKVAVHSDAAVADLYTPGGLFICGCPRTKEAYKTYAERTPEASLAFQTQLKTKNDTLQSIVNFNEEVKKSAAAIMPYGIAVAANADNRVKDEYNDAHEEMYNESIDAAPEKKLSGRAKAYKDF